jgi:hypothetical protein
VVAKRIVRRVEAEQRLDFRPERRVDVMRRVVGFPLRRRSLGKLAKQGQRVGVHGWIEVQGPGVRPL